MRNTKRQTGFTLIEIAIVLVIIGLLLGGVLKGQELIENGKAKNAIADLNGVASAYRSYVDRYKAIPGDETTAQMNLRGWTITDVGNGNGVLNVNLAQSIAGTGESAEFFRALKQAGFLNGDPTQTALAALPKNAYNGFTTVVSGVAVMGLPIGTMMVCMTNVPGKAAIAIDNALDDGAIGTGSVRGTLQGANPTAPAAAAATVAYTEAAFYTLCRTI